MKSGKSWLKWGFISGWRCPGGRPENVEEFNEAFNVA